MLIHAPFYPNNDDFHCVNAVMQSVLRFYQRKDYSVTYLDSLMRRKPESWPWCPECALVMHELGLSVKYYGRINMMDYLKGEDFIKLITGNDYIHYTKRTDYDNLNRAVYRLDALKLFEERDLSLDEIKSFMTKGFTPIFLIRNMMNPESRLGKYVIVTGIDKESVYYHETGPKEMHPNYKVGREQFMDAWVKTRELILVTGTQALNPLK